MKLWHKFALLVAFVAVLILVEYLTDNSIDRAAMTFSYRKEFVLAAFIAGLLSPGLDGWKHNVVIYPLCFVGLFAWSAMLGLEVITVPFWDPGWHWTGSWWNLPGLGLTFAEYILGVIISSLLFVPKDEATRCACASE